MAVLSAILVPLVGPWLGLGFGALGGVLVASAAAMWLALRHSRADLDATRELLDALIHGAGDSIAIKDRDGRYQLINEAGAILVGRPAAEIVGRTDADLFPVVVANQLAAHDAEVLATGGPRVFEEVLFEGGQRRVLRATKGVVRGPSGDVLGTFSIARDITGLGPAEADARNLAMVDELTGLYNRRGFYAMAAQYLRLARREKRRSALLFCDFDGLKQVNDTFGHPKGDRALLDAADALRETFRTSDILGRIGGDEFAVVIIDADLAAVHAAVDRLQETIRKKNAELGRQYLISLSVGHSHADPDAWTSVEDLVAAADAEMYRAKDQRKPG